jgi:hypothetical protein
MKKPKSMTQAQLAAKFKVARQSISAWKREGVDLTDMKALEGRAAAMKTRVADSEDMQAAKLRKVSAEADRQQIAAKREAGELVPAANIFAEGEAAGRAFQTALNRLEGGLPGRLAGRTAGEIKGILHTSFRELLQELADRPAEKYLKLP